MTKKATARLAEITLMREGATYEEHKSLQIYFVENILPREKRTRKSLVYRWAVIASSCEEAVDKAVEASVREVLPDGDLDAETMAEEKRRGQWIAEAEGQISRLSNRFTWKV